MPRKGRTGSRKIADIVASIDFRLNGEIPVKVENLHRAGIVDHDVALYQLHDDGREPGHVNHFQYPCYMRMPKFFGEAGLAKELASQVDLDSAAVLWAQSEHLHQFGAQVLAMSGRTAEVKTLPTELEHDPNKNASAFFEMALAYEVSGERKAAFSALTKAVEGGYPLGAIQNEPQFLELRPDPPYQTLAARRNSK